jgi:hypothetical protein
MIGIAFPDPRICREPTGVKGKCRGEGDPDRTGRHRAEPRLHRLHLLRPRYGSVPVFNGDKGSNPGVGRSGFAGLVLNGSSLRAQGNRSFSMACFGRAACARARVASSVRSSVISHDMGASDLHDLDGWRRLRFRHQRPSAHWRSKSERHGRSFLRTISAGAVQDWRDEIARFCHCRSVTLRTRSTSRLR